MPRNVQSLAPARLRLRHLQPLCLALLARQPGSGYDVVAALSALPLFATDRPDAPGVYRTLQAFEKRGLLRGKRQLSAKGPDRREYTLTPAGHVCLAQWQKVLLSAREEMDAVLALVQRGKKNIKPSLPTVGRALRARQSLGQNRGQRVTKKLRNCSGIQNSGVRIQNERPKNRR